jgi:tRNA-splicing ligase RtcB
MAAVANFAWANRATLAHRVRQAVARVLGADVARETRQVYDVAHNVAKLERHGGRELCVLRKGATRAFPQGDATCFTSEWLRITRVSRPDCAQPGA